EGRAPREGGHDGDAEASLRRPLRREDERREAVGAAGPARPEAGVAGGDGVFDPAPLVVQLNAVEGDGDAVAPVAIGHLGGSSLQARTIADWLAVASRVPSW